MHLPFGIIALLMLALSVVVFRVKTRQRRRGNDALYTADIDLVTGKPYRSPNAGGEDEEPEVDSSNTLYAHVPDVPHDRCAETILDEYDSAVGYPPDWVARKNAVKLRDADRCRILGCINTEGIDVHHIEPIHERPESPDHRLENLICICKFHHFLIDDYHTGVAERIEDPRFSAIRGYWRKNRRLFGRHLVPAHVQRKIRVSIAELSEIREYFGLKCQCGGSSLAVRFYEQTNDLLITCGTCWSAWVFERGLREEIGPQLVSVLNPTQNSSNGIPQKDSDWKTRSPVRVYLCQDCRQAGKRIEMKRRFSIYGYFWTCPNWGGDRGHYKRRYHDSDRLAALAIARISSGTWGRNRVRR